MKILFLTDNFPPEVNAPATRTYEHCVEWVKRGEDVTVITCFPNFPNGRVFSGYKNSFYKKEYIEGVKVIRIWTYIAANKGFLKRVFDFISYALMAFLFGLFQKSDLIIGTSPQFFTVISARCLSFVKRIPWVMEVRDIWPESIAAVGAMNKNSSLYKLLETAEKSLYRSSKKIVVVTDAFKKNIISKGVKASKITVIKNGVIASKFQPTQKNIDLIKKHKLDGKIVVSYIGTHGMAHGLDFILDCVSEMTDLSYHFIFQGEGSEKRRLLKKAKSLTNVSFLPSVSKSELQKYISISDIALVNLIRSETFKTVIPSKIFENVCMEKPILLGVEGEAKKLIENYNVGLCFEPENKRSFIQALKKMSSFNDNMFHDNCKKMTSDFNRQKLAHEMLKSIKT